MTDHLTQTAVRRTRAHIERAAPTRTFFRFMALPIDIRLMIYDDLLVQNFDLYRTSCESCPVREAYSATPMDSANHKSYAYLACTQILRTNKQICSEAIARLYLKNTVHVKCRKCEASEFFLDLWPCLVEPHRHLSTRHDHYYPHVKNIAIVYEVGRARPYCLLEQLTARWPTIDDTITLRYENTKHISLRIRSSDRNEITVDFGRRIYNPPTERAHDYENVLTQAIPYDANDKDDTLALVILENICDDIVLSHACGGLRFPAFAVQSIRWKPSKEDTKELVIPLGCDKHAPSDTFIKSISAEILIRTQARRLLIDSYLGDG